MGDLISPIVDILDRLCGYCSKRADSIREIEDNLNSLEKDSGDLNSRYLDIEAKVRNAEQDPNRELTVKNEVRRWMGKVQDLQSKVQAILQQGKQEEIQARCFGGRCPKNCRARYKLSKRVTQKLREVSVLKKEGNFEVIAEKLDLDRFKKLPNDKNVGSETKFEELCSCFENNQEGTIGLYGMGGVGKTTLLKKFNNDFLSTKAYDVVLWAVASKDADPGKIQDDIRKKLGVQDDIWNMETMDARATRLYNILEDKKFVLLLDDVWERIDLLKLGVPSPNDHECKIIFTTRSKEVCGQMGAQGYSQIRVDCLPPDKAFELFKEKVGETILKNPQILALAQQVADECQGLPLALCTVGRAMSYKETSDEWRRSLAILKSYPSKVQGIVENVYNCFEFSYDRLSDAYKSCFLYCALFPEDYDIPKERIILLWIAEGFLADFDHNIRIARQHGEEIISGLKYACLLEDGEREDTIKMHDVVKDMALWVACDHGKNMRFFVSDHSVTSGYEIYSRSKWEEVEMLSLYGKGETFMNFLPMPHCPNLVTFLTTQTHTKAFPTSILSTTIRILDLSWNSGIQYLPSKIGDFVNLKYMNLSFTSIKKLPKELKNLKKLRFLLLDGIVNLEFSKEVISSLKSLQAFSFTRMLGDRIIDEHVLLNELEVLDCLQDICIYVCSISSVEKILNSSKLQSCIRRLTIFVSSRFHDLFSSLPKMKHLEEFIVYGLKDSKAAYIPMRSALWEHNQPIIFLRNLTIVMCDNILDLSWLIHAPNLERLRVDRCDSLVEVISEDFGTERVKSGSLFYSLAYLCLESLSNLKSICRMALQCPCLKEIKVTKCPNLKKLPFNSQSVLKNLQRFKGDSLGWLDHLEWEDEATKHLLSSKFVQAD